MIIRQVKGYEIEKTKSNSFEDLFNQSEVTFIEDGKEVTFHLLYLRYFDEIFHEFVPFANEPLYSVGGKDFYFKDIVGLICFIQDAKLRNRKRFYINEKNKLQEYCHQFDYKMLPEIVGAIAKGGYEFKSRAIVNH